MTDFARYFAVEALARWHSEHPNTLVERLFRSWALPGEATTGDTPLRLALRDGYANFYAKGQSVAKLSIGSSGPSLSVHNAYVTARKAGAPRTQNYVTFTPQQLAESGLAAELPNWVKAAHQHATAEKRFVDDLIAANPGVLDIEMALPAGDTIAGQRVAPRMDLVIAQRQGEAAPMLAFWEAKCANNSELRSRKDRELLGDGKHSGPHVLSQVQKYVDWISEDGRASQVRTAYVATAETVEALHRLFFGSAQAKTECLTLWRATAEAVTLEIVNQPGVVIGNYWPTGSSDEVASDRMAQSARSFARNGHRQKLEENDITVHEVGPDHGSAVLPFLAGE